jgi:hypothetical protein
VDPIRDLHTGPQLRGWLHYEAGHTAAPELAQLPLKNLSLSKGRPHTTFTSGCNLTARRTVWVMVPLEGFGHYQFDESLVV